MRRGFLEAFLTIGHRADLAGEANLAEHDGLFRQRPVAKTRLHREQDRQIRCGFLHADAADDVDEHVLVINRCAAMPMQYREQHRETVLFEAECDSARIAERGLIDQRLHLDQQGPRAFAGDHHRAA